MTARKSTVKRDSFSNPQLENKSSASVSMPFKFSSILGRREDNEDAHIQFAHLNLFICAVFDGHNGAIVSNYCKQNLQIWFSEFYEPDLPMSSVLRKVIKAMDNSIQKEPKAAECGCTAVVCVIDSFMQQVHIATVGDSRLIVGYHDGTMKITPEHRPDNEKEKQRLEKLNVSTTCVEGTWRIEGKLSVSRSIGDLYMKHCVISDPDCFSYPLAGAAFMIIACDGLFEQLTPEKVMSLAQVALNLKMMSCKEEKTFLSYFNGDDMTSNVAMKKVNGQLLQTMVFENVQSSQSVGRRLAQALTKAAYLGGSSDNVTVGVMIADM